jgi:PleD family two-component response regulator
MTPTILPSVKVSQQTNLNTNTTTNTPKGSLFLIEDSATQSAQFQMHFQQQNYTVTAAFNGQQALALLGELKTTPNLIILDFLLPDTDGVALCQKIKSNPALSQIPVLVYSGENKLMYMSQAYQAGADYYLVKGQEGLATLEMLIDTIITRQKRRNRNSNNMRLSA